MKRIFMAAIAGALSVAALLPSTVVTSALAASGSQSSSGFVLVSNRSGKSQMACVTSSDVQNKNPAVSKPFCRWIGSKNTETWSFTSASVQDIEVRDTRDNGRSFLVKTSASHCYRYSASGSFHEATDSPCTRD